MAGTTKYDRSPTKYNKDATDYLHIQRDGGIAVKIDKEGKVHARGFVDTNDSMEFFMDDGEITCSTNQAAATNYKTHYGFETTTNYIYSQAVYQRLSQAFQSYVYPSHLYDHKNIPKYIRLNKKTKSLISEGTMNESIPRSFHPNYFVKNNHRYVDPKVEGTWLGPYNYDTYIKTENMIQGMDDLIVIKSGKLKQRADFQNMDHGIKEVLYTTGVSGHVHVESTSIPEHIHNQPNANSEIKTFKFKNSGHNSLAEASASVPISSGVAGMFVNGVFLHSFLNGKSYQNSGKWNEDSAFTEKSLLDDCGGGVQADVNVENLSSYNYKTLPLCLYSVDTGAHSPLLGFARDGYPIYGPVAYSGAADSSGPLKILQPSYKLKQASSRAEGPNFDATYVSGYYSEDYEYAAGLGDLDEHNGRTGITPEYPNGTYAYFTTVDENHSPKYPYVVGNTYRGNIDYNDGLVSAVTESPIYDRLQPIIPESAKYYYYPNPRVNCWEVYGDTNYKTEGLISEKIIFVSPHILKEADGVFLKTGYIQALKSTGIWDYNLNTGSGMATYSGNRFTATGNGKFLTLNTGFRYPTSDLALIPGDRILQSGMRFSYLDEDGGGLIPATATESITGTYFYSAYSGHKRVLGKVDTRPWDGKIPAGTPFRIESWAFNGNSIGFNGELAIIPCVPHPMTSGNTITFFTQASGYGDTQVGARKDAMKTATESLMRQNNLLLIASGIKNKNSHMRSWVRLKENQTTIT